MTFFVIDFGTFITANKITIFTAYIAIIFILILHLLLLIIARFLFQEETLVKVVVNPKTLKTALLL